MTMTQREPVTRVAVLIPTYNERDNLPGIVARVRANVPSADVFVLDDGSPDGTGEVADVIAATDPHLPEQLPSLLAALGGADLVIGARWVRGGEVRNWPAHRKVLSVGANVYTKVLLGMHVNDATAGYRAYRTSALRTMGLSGVESQGYCFQIDLTLRAIRAGLTVVEVPITFVERQVGVSKMGHDIVREALTRVTRWGVEHRMGQLRAAAGRVRGREPVGDRP